MYKDLDVWKDSVTLIQNVYNVADKLPKSEEYNLKSQIKRAVVSIALNIAEGKTRKSAKDFSHFLNISVLNKIKGVKKETYEKVAVNTVGVSGGIASGVTALKEQTEKDA